MIATMRFSRIQLAGALTLLLFIWLVILFRFVFAST
ncbi:MAG: hypothetical protein QOC61_1965 [Acidobacteriota bacterium]|jgi:hypothetical protein|nr:hypothetical protein [Acidobacteriota bacterium]MDT5262961.1 hypothetical protein [Acidobacteriota bacterium]MDT7781494.1 hypothetical protein [Acidobacteriota bacterium]